MCGRVVTTSSPEELVKYLDVDEVLDVLGAVDYNLAPSGRLPLVWAEFGSGDSLEMPTRFLSTARWGLVPQWAKDPAIGARMFNARAETLAQKPAFRMSYARRRCLIPVDGFYEWAVGLGGQPKQPWYVYRPDGDPLVLAGLWECWSSPSSQKGELRTCTVITVLANEDLRPVHQRMPALLSPEDWAGWLDPWEVSHENLDCMLRSAPDGLLACHPVAPRVNDARNMGSDLVEAVTADLDQRPPGEERLW